jgi:hypothetical protein
MLMLVVAAATAVGNTAARTVGRCHCPYEADAVNCYGMANGSNRPWSTLCRANCTVIRTVQYSKNFHANKCSTGWQRKNMCLLVVPSFNIICYTPVMRRQQKHIPVSTR